MKLAKIIPNQQLQINNIFCIGKNYALHAIELGGEVPSEPVIFLKPNSAVVFNNSKIQLPKFSKNIHHEVELVLLIGKEGKNIDETDALNFISGYGIGLDLTLRDIQSESKKTGNPWTIAKGFDFSAPISDFVSGEKIKNPNELEINLKINGELKQFGNTKNMIYSVEKLVSYISKIFTLQKGDLIYTGTPEGVGPIKNGDKLIAELINFTSLEITIE